MSDLIKLVCLDTMILRYIIDESQDVSSEFLKIKNNKKVKFRIAETAYSEILADLLDGSIDISAWNKQKKCINDFLDSSKPIQELGYNLSVDMGTYVVEKQRETFYKKKYWVKSWANLLNIENIDDLTKPFIYYHEHKPYKLRIREDLIEPAFDDTRREWYAYFDNVKGIGNSKTTFEEIKQDFIKGFSVEYDTTKMMDLLCGLAHYTFKYFEDKNFNPYSKKRRNDSIDFSFLQVLEIPSLFCSNDEKFKKFIVNSGAPNADRIMTNTQIIDYYN